MWGQESSARAPLAWERGAVALLRWGESRAQLLACATPTNLASELARLESLFTQARPECGSFQYARPPADDPSEPLLRGADQLEKQGPLAQLYAGRCRELALEAHLARQVGQASFGQQAAERYGLSEAQSRACLALCTRWLEEAPPEETPEEAALILSHASSDPRSLLRQMQRAVGRLRLPLRVALSDQLSARAAVAPGCIYIAVGLGLRARDAQRTVIHEIEGHVLPDLRAQRAPLGIFACGTAAGIDHQEGRAIWLEEDRGLLSVRRRRELAQRHLAACAVRKGADLVETTRLLQKMGASLREALRLASRAHRGGGLARELIYLPSFLAYREALEQRPHVAQVLTCGRVSLDAAPALASWATETTDTATSAFEAEALSWLCGTTVG